ncbi:MAG: hypothetical protein U1F34_01395 [Gammaproteobacteria bacterium]
MFEISFRKLLIIVAVGVWLWMEFIHTPANALSATHDGKYKISELQPYAETVRILSTEEYHFGRESDISPMDIAVGWGDMARPEIYKQFKISQSGRWYFWESDDLPIPRRDVETHSANMHLVPATPEIADRLRRIKRNDVVQLSGALIEVDANDGWHWRSSLSREDIGEGACELLLLKKLDWTPAMPAAASSP